MNRKNPNIKAYADWEGKLGKTFAGSEPWWPERVQAHQDAPNVIIVLIDDLGYSDLGCFGGEISTPNIDQLAEDGLRYTNFHVNPMCSPTRAALLTGLNAHDAGFGHVAHSDSGYPGYAMELTEHSATLAEIFRDTGYNTMAIGKWHLCKDSDKNPSAPKHSWPLQRGFDQFYGILGGFTNFHHPDRLIDGNSFVDVDQYPKDYYLTDDLNTRAIRMIKESKAANPAKPFFMYLAHPAVHAPLQAKSEDIEKYKDKYNAGWDDIRQSRYEKQKALGIIDSDTPMPPSNSETNHDVSPWDELEPKTQELYSRYMEIYAGMVDNVDQNIGELLEALEELGERENTIIIFTSDNGASREGEANGCSQYFEQLSPNQERSEKDYERLDKLGGPETLPHYPYGWAMACNTPFRLYKCNTHAGGHQVPMIFTWPAGQIPKNEMRSQYLHVTDILPTLCDLMDIAIPETRNGKQIKPLAGASFRKSIFTPNAASDHTLQIYENQGHRGIYKDGWEAITLHQPMTPFEESEWELYNLAKDPTECENLAKTNPEKLKELIKLWEDEALKGQVYPLDEGAWVKWQTRPPTQEVYERPVTVFPGTPSVEGWRCGELIHTRSFQICISLDFRSGDAGTLIAHGDQGGGYGVYVIDDELLYIHNGYGTMHELSGGKLDTGVQEILLDFDGSTNLIWNLTMSVDGKEVGSKANLEMLLAIAPFQGIDVGIDRRSPISWNIYEKYGCFPYSGTLHSATWTPGKHSEGLGPELVKTLREMGSRFE